MDRAPRCGRSTTGAGHRRASGGNTRSLGRTIGNRGDSDRAEAPPKTYESKRRGTIQRRSPERDRAKAGGRRGGLVTEGRAVLTTGAVAQGDVHGLVRTAGGSGLLGAGSDHRSHLRGGEGRFESSLTGGPLRIAGGTGARGSGVRERKPPEERLRREEIRIGAAATSRGRLRTTRRMLPGMNARGGRARGPGGGLTLREPGLAPDIDLATFEANACGGGGSGTALRGTFPHPTSKGRT